MLIEEMKIPIEQLHGNKETKIYYLRKMLENLSGIVFSTLFAFLYDVVSEVIKSSDGIHTPDGFFKVILMASIFGFVVYGRRFYIALRQYLKYRNIAKHLKLIANVILQNLISEKIILTSEDKLKIVTSGDQYKNSVCHLEGGTNYEKSQFIKTLQEFIIPVDNPRYILEQKKNFFFIKNSLFFPVPEVFAKNKRSAEFFNKTWSRNFDTSDLIFTRTIKGRQILLKLRYQSLLKRNSQIEHLHKWTR